MSITAKNTGASRELIPTGNYIARCYSMIHLGTKKENILGAEKILNKVRITWELPTETKVFSEDKGEQPFVISKEYTLSMHEKANLRKDLESWRGKGFTDDEAKSFDITKLLGIPCMINVIHKVSKSGTEYATISAISGMPKGTQCPDPYNQPFEWNFEDKFDVDILDTLPDFIKDRIKESDEYKNKQNPESVFDEANEDDDLPF